LRPTSAKRLPRVCQLLHSLEIGGAEVLAARMARGLRDQFHFSFACLDELGTLGRALSAEGFEVRVLGRGQGLDLRCARRLRRFVASEAIDVLHVHQYTPFFYAMLSRGLGRGRPVLFTEHGRFHPDFRRPKRVLFNRLTLRRRDRVVGVGEAVRQALIHHEGIPPRRVAVVYNGIEIDHFASGAGQRDSVRRELGLATDDFVAIQVARLDYLKDHVTAVRSIGVAASKIPSLQLIVVGEGPERGKIEAAIRDAGLDARVKLLGRRQDVPRLLAAADVLLLSSISEGIPLTVIEGMAAGLPVVSTDVGGVAEIIHDGQTGLLAPASDPERLADCLVRLAGQPDLRAELRARGREVAIARFSERAMLDSYAALYEEMLHG
jgi:glycosyltransferase involved in cell wall biosynthesis